MAFDEASDLVLDYLTEHIPMGIWSVTRVENGDQTHIRFSDRVYGVPEGFGVPWQQGLCIHMVEGSAPRVAADVSTVPEFHAAQQKLGIPIGSYAGAPIVEPDGALFGVLCGHDPETREQEFVENQALLEMITALLNAVLAADRDRDRAAREATLAQLALETDALTGLHNLRAWQRLLAEEEARYAKFADPTVVAFIDIDGLKAVNDADGHSAGDRCLTDTAAALVSAVRGGDPVARIGGDEFTALLPGCPAEEAEQRIARIRGALEEHGVSASVGWASVRPTGGFEAAQRAADESMYAEKRRRRDAAIRS